MTLRGTNIFAMQDKLQAAPCVEMSDRVIWAGADARPSEAPLTARLRLPPPGLGPGAARRPKGRARPLEPQAPVHLEAAAGKEIVLEYKQHRMSDFLGCPRRFNGTGAVSFSSTSGRIEARISVWVKPGAIDPTRMP